MLNMPSKVNITHPSIRNVYLKKDFGYGHRGDDVLVIETTGHYRTGKTDQSFLDLLTDLQDIQNLAEQSVGHFDRVDIVSH